MSEGAFIRRKVLHRLWHYENNALRTEHIQAWGEVFHIKDKIT